MLTKGLNQAILYASEKTLIMSNLQEL